MKKINKTKDISKIPKAAPAKYEDKKYLKGKSLKKTRGGQGGIINNYSGASIGGASSGKETIIMSSNNNDDNYNTGGVVGRGRISDL
ncbi:MAG: hypothetical protein P4L16_01665 [Chlamydiales bacterium]|nr:hypothetical protein [Chlamydiales bacterium]